jgi:peptide deformylase
MPKILKIFTIPDQKLKQKSVTFELRNLTNKEYRDLISNMKTTMLAKDGVGLAAPQIGRNIRLIVVNTKDGPIAVINPKIVKKSLLKEWGEEGCLSVPNTFGQVKRHKKIVCVFNDENGQKVRIEAQGLMARVFQHEIDHLDGVLFIDQAKDLKTA